MLDYALNYAGRGWRCFPVHTTVSGTCSCGRACGKDAGKHPHIKAWQTHATTDRSTIEGWWRKWPQANIGIATGGGLVVLDLDGTAEIEAFRRIAAPHGGLPPTLVARTARGFHLYLAGDWPTTKKVDGLLVRGTGGYVVASPSWHASGIRYSWAKDLPVAPMPQWFANWLAQGVDNHGTNGTAGVSPLAGLTGELPAYIRNKTKGLASQSSSVGSSVAAALRDPWSPAIEARVRSALSALPANCGRDDWLHVGMALHACDWARPDGTDAGFDLWLAWSSTGGDKFAGEHDCAVRWKSFGKRAGVGLGTLFHKAEQAGWLGYAVDPDAPKPAVAASPFPFEALNGPVLKANGHHVEMPAELQGDERNPLVILNKSYSVIGDVGGKCLVLGWVPSKVDAAVRLPSFQTFKSFGDRYANRRADVIERGKDGEAQEVKSHPLGAYWLKWKGRQTFEGIDLIPGKDGILPGNVLNLWQGFAVKPAAGSWAGMQRHIVEILAGGDVEAARYIVNWAAWAVQNPGERAEAALVLRGGKGAGKGLFARALRRIFGQHGLQIYNPKHLVGAFNGHLRNCLLLYADEAFWAGDKQGESVLKGLITEPTIPIEHKGVDVEQWRNRIHLIMTANADWVVPASHDERRYCVLDVSDAHARSKSYFDPIYAELDAGGYEAMLHDLLALELGIWHPRHIVNTEALRLQKARSMSPLHEWFEAMLQDGVLPYVNRDMPDTCAAGVLIEHARSQGGRLKEANSTMVGRFLRDMGVIKIHRAAGNVWRFPPLQEVRGKWETRFSGWRWEEKFTGWQVRT